MPTERLNIVQVLQTLLRCTLEGHQAEVSLGQESDWEELFRLCCRHNVAPLASAALESCEEVPFVTMLKFAAMQEKAARHYVKVLNVAAELSAAFQTEGLRTVILKGLTLSRLYPVPELRDFSDLDILVVRDDDSIAFDAADGILKSIGAHPVKSGYHHSSHTYKSIYVENHFDLISKPIRRSAADYEEILKAELPAHLEPIDITGQKAYAASPDFEALYLIRHSAVHFEKDCISVRHLIDWLQFLRHRGEKVNWQRVCDIFRRFGMERYTAVLTAILKDKFAYNCPYVELLQAQVDVETVDRVWEEILKGNTRKIDSTGHGTAIRLLGELKRTYRYRWKHDLCTNDPLWLDDFYAARAAVHRLIHKN